MSFKKVTYKTGEDARINTVEPIRSRKDLHRIMRFFDEMGWHKYSVIFWLGVNSGLRISDILGFKVKDVRGKRQYVLREQKTGKVKKFPVKDELYDLINNWVKDKDDNDWVFEGRKNKKLDRSQVYRRINEAVLALDIDANVGTHTLRKTFGYHAYKQCKDIAVLQQIFNHTTPDVTKRYIGITQDEMDQVYLSLDLSDDEDNLKKFIDGRSRKRIQRIVSFINNYLKNGGTEHRPFALIILELIGITWKQY